MSDTAYVLIQGPGKHNPSVHPVRLLSRAAVQRIAQRREAILAGATEPRRARSDALCRQCSHLERCRPELAVRRTAPA